MGQTLYRRPLPPDAIAFSSSDGRKVFAEALATEGLDGYFPLAEQFHTQSDPAFCGLGALVVALNALGIDPGRLWKGPWRWFAEDLLDCCVPLTEVRERGLDIDELACLARCNGADVEVHRGDAANLSDWRAALKIAASAQAVIVASYDRAAMGHSTACFYATDRSRRFERGANSTRLREASFALWQARFRSPGQQCPTVLPASGPLGPATRKCAAPGRETATTR